MSPELFKCYLLDLSDDLNSNLMSLDLPELNGKPISHLLWADDLVLMALNRSSLQNLIARVCMFCQAWGLTVNISKTAVMVFNKAGRQLKESYGYKFGSENIPSTKTYCYLGIVFSLSGSFRQAQDELKKKGLRAYFSLKSLIDLRQLSTKSVFKLFDALILPVCSYGCQVWIATTPFFSLLASGKIKINSTNSIKKIYTEALEQIHLKFLKWTLSVHKKTSNLACWGDSGRMPLVLTLAKQVKDYFNRLDAMDAANEDTLVRHAFVEQRILNLAWYNNIQKSTDALGTQSDNGTQFREQAKRLFDDLWKEGVNSSSKLEFYASVKSNIGFEPYLEMKSREKRTSIARLRTSSHRLRIETGRYSLCNRTWNKCCVTCMASDAEDLIHLPFADPVLEDEQHILVTCPRYHYIRSTVSDDLLCKILRWDWKDLFLEQNISGFASYVNRIFLERFPKQQRR